MSTLLDNEIEPVEPHSEEVKPLTTCLGQELLTGDAYTEALSSKFKSLLKNHLNLPALLRNCKIHSWVPSPKLTGFRNYVKLVVSDNFDIGLYKVNSHEIVDATECPTHHPHINFILKKLKEKLPDLADAEIPIHFRYISIKLNPATLETMIVFVVKEMMPLNEIREIVLDLNVFDAHVVSCYMNINESTGNEIFGRKNVWVFGKNTLKVKIGSDYLDFGPTSFMQSNLSVAELIYQRISDVSGEGEGCHALDLYSGSGVIAAQLVSLGYTVTTVEENPVATELAEKHFANEKNITIMTGKTEDCLEKLRAHSNNLDVIVVNPSRKGMNLEVCRFLQKTLEEQPHCCLIYVSCDLSSLGRDAQILCSNDVQINQIEAYDMFPHTEHMEWLGIFQAKQYKSMWNIREGK